LITTIIFSKNRPIQLDLAINSLKKNFLDCNEIIVLNSYDEEYLESLDILKGEHQDVKFHDQSKCIYKDVKDLSILAKNNHICFFTDDNIFYRFMENKSNVYEEIFSIEQIPICCISLRLGLNICRRSIAGKWHKDEPVFAVDGGDVMVIPKTNYAYGSYWSYSHSVDGHIFERQYVRTMMSELQYLDERYKFKQTPNELETQMQRFWPISKDAIIAPKQSHVVNTPNNRVSETHNENFAGEYHYLDSSFLLGKYMSGKRIDIDLLNFDNIECPHQEINILEGIT